MLIALSSTAKAQTDVIFIDTIADPTLNIDGNDAILVDEGSLALDSIVVGKKAKKAKRDWNTWRPDVKKAMWLAIVIPGAGQIYNRKYWKLPIVYGGFMGCIYAMRWNNQMFHDYSQAYIDLTDDDPNTKSYERFQQFSNRITDANIQRYQELFKNRKNRFRRWRDLSFFVMCGVYAISIIDAYVDASLSEFDISDDLTMRVAPTIINNKNVAEHNPLKSTAIGLQCSLFF
jgi:hypothetical protein